MIGRRIRALCPDARGLNILGLGYASPFLGVFRAEAERVLAVMPAGQGVLHWPAEAPGLTTLSDETSLPLADRAIDLVLLVHALECAEHTRPMMREIWRVLADGGRMIVVVPNRRGLWARFERTPFGHGRPIRRRALARAARYDVHPYRSDTAPPVPPIRSRMPLSSAGAWEKIGERWFTSFAGVVIFEASKQIFAGHGTWAAATARQRPCLPAGSGKVRSRGYRLSSFIGRNS